MLAATPAATSSTNRHWMGRAASWLAQGGAGAKNRWYPAENCWGKFAYTLGPTGIRTRIDEADGTARGYQYDDLYRLTKETVTGGTDPAYEKSFAYDAVSNRMSQVTTGTGAGSVGYTYDSRDRLMSEGTTAYGWTDNGNLMSKAGEAGYEWDFEDRLVKVTKADGTVVENVYDVDGVLVKLVATPSVGAAKVTDLLVDTSGGLSQVVAEVDGTGTVTTLYVRAGDMLLEEIRGGVARMYEADGLGSVRSLLDVNGARTDAYSYEAYGSTLSSTGTDENPYRFAGERYVDKIGIYQNRARWLDTGTGRFVSVDPEDGQEGQPITFASYLYAAAGPVTYVDATGRFETLVGLMISVPISSIHFAIATPRSMAPSAKPRLYVLNFLGSLLEEPERRVLREIAREAPRAKVNLVPPTVATQRDLQEAIVDPKMVSTVVISHGSKYGNLWSMQGWICPTGGNGSCFFNMSARDPQLPRPEWVTLAGCYLGVARDRWSATFGNPRFLDASDLQVWPRPADFAPGKPESSWTDSTVTMLKGVLDWLRSRN